MSATVQQFEHSLALPFFGTGMKTDLFQSCGHCWVFQICWHIECSTFTASSFRIWNNSTGIPSPPIALFVVMLPKTHLTAFQEVWFYMSDHTIVVTWVMKIFFVQFFYVFFPPPLNIFLRVGLRRLRAEKLMLSSCGARKDFWESLRQQGDQTSQS